MVNYCVVQFCNGNPLRGKRIFRFPAATDPRFRAWVGFVQRKRADFKAPGPAAVICEDHFVPSDFVQSDVLMGSLGFKPKGHIRLRDTAVPSVYPTLVDPAVMAKKKAKGSTRRQARGSSRDSRDPVPSGSAAQRPCLRWDRRAFYVVSS